jgi:hypothetical protein
MDAAYISYWKADCRCPVQGVRLVLAYKPRKSTKLLIDDNPVMRTTFEPKPPNSSEDVMFYKSARLSSNHEHH